MCNEVSCLVLSTLSQQVEVRWLRLAVLADSWQKYEGKCHGKGTAGLYSRANLFLHCANLPPSSTVVCSRPRVSNPCKRKDCQENKIKQKEF